MIITPPIELAIFPTPTALPHIPRENARNKSDVPPGDIDPYRNGERASLTTARASYGKVRPHPCCRCGNIYLNGHTCFIGMFAGATAACTVDLVSYIRVG